MTTYRYLLLAETITSDEDGQTVEGSHGLLDHLDQYVPMDGYTGSIAAKVLRDNERRVDLETLRDLVASYGPADDVDERDKDEAIIYLADLPRVEDDEPYVRAIAVRGPDVVAALEAWCDECGGELDRDCFGDFRCPDCDEPCPGCFDGPGVNVEEVAR